MHPEVLVLPLWQPPAGIYVIHDKHERASVKKTMSENSQESILSRRLNFGICTSSLEIVTPGLPPSGKDVAWDSFLEKTPYGRHEQSSLWGQVKSLSGWRSLRYVFRVDEEMVAGFQALWRSSPLGKIAYISKGPVVTLDDPKLFDVVVTQIQNMARNHRFRAVLVQPPCVEQGLADFLARRRFLPYGGKNVMRETAEIDLGRDEVDLLRSMRSDRRKSINKALRSGIVVHEGSESELPTLFDLMIETCRRRGVQPNPPNLDVLQTMWRLYQPRGWLHLFLATYNGEYVSGHLIVTFGDRVFFWKTGWSGAYSESRPNDMLNWTCIRWAKASGYRFVDYCGIDPNVATAVTKPGPLSSQLMNTATYYTLGYGVRRVPLGDPQVYLPSGLGRRIYGLVRNILSAFRS